MPVETVEILPKNLLTMWARVQFHGGSLQKVQGHRAAQGHRAGVNADSTTSKGGPVVEHACR